jgi:hypothetical protein
MCAIASHDGVRIIEFIGQMVAARLITVQQGVEFRLMPGLTIRPEAGIARGHTFNEQAKDVQTHLPINIDKAGATGHFTGG